MTSGPQTRKALFAAAENSRPPMHFIAGGFQGADLYIGNRHAASDLALLSAHGIGAVLNCAVNLDIDLVSEPAKDIRALPFGWAPVRYYKVGLVDGAGNPGDMLMAGYLQLRGLLGQVMPEKASYPWKERGNVLVHCRGGRSRSVILVAMFLHLECPEIYPDLDAAIAHIRMKRELVPEEWPSAPKNILIDAANRCLPHLKQLIASSHPPQ